MKAVKRGKLKTKCLQKETGESLHKQLDRIPESSRKKKKEEEANTPMRSRRQEIIKLRAEINQVETKRTNKTRSLFFKTINKTDRPLARLNGGHRDSIQINKIRNEK